MPQERDHFVTNSHHIFHEFSMWFFMHFWSDFRLHVFEIRQFCWAVKLWKSSKNHGVLCKNKVSRFYVQWAARFQKHDFWAICWLKIARILAWFSEWIFDGKKQKNNQILGQKSSKIHEKLETTKMEVKNEPRERFLSNFGAFWVPLGIQERPKIVKKGVQEGMQKTVKKKRVGNQRNAMWKDNVSI